MSEEKKSQEQVRVIDRRHFSQSGEKRDDSCGCHGSQSVGCRSVDEVPVNKAAEEDPAQADKDKDDGRFYPQLDFSTFVVSMATQALALMGEAPHPELQNTPVNLEASKQTIDILGILADKTKGNLSGDEDKLLKEILTNVRMAFVHTVKKSKS